jgi:hypothetical protein
VADNQGERGEKGIQGVQGVQGNQGLPYSENDGFPVGTPAWLKMIICIMQKFGVATLLVLLGGWWVATRVAEPMISAYGDFIKAEAKTAADQAETLRGFNETLKTLKEAETTRLAQIKESQAIVKSLSEKTDKDHAIMLANLTQQLEDHKSFMNKMDRVLYSVPASMPPHPEPASTKPGT